MQQVRPEEVRQAIAEYYEAYREYKQLDNVRAHICVEMSGNTLIEIHRYYGDRKGELILRVTREETEGEGKSAEVAAYEQATEQLLSMIKGRHESLEKWKKHYGKGRADILTLPINKKIGDAGNDSP